jgi:biopolymer transport protein ExbD
VCFGGSKDKRYEYRQTKARIDVEILEAGVLLQTNDMTDINTAVNDSRRAGVRKMTKHRLKIDMTPMVDLGFLLITFFIMTTELSKPTVMDLFMPKDGHEMPLGESNALTVLFDGDKMFYYNGKWEDAVKKGSILQTGFSGSHDLRNVIEAKQTELEQSQKNKEGRDGLMLLIKPGKNASYKSVVDVLDEMTISRVKKYALVKLSEEEDFWMRNK